MTAVRYFDIGVNLTDRMFAGFYHGKKAHDSDLHEVINRALKFGVDKMLVTGASLNGSKDSIEICRKYPGTLYSTVGVHPCSVNEFVKAPESHLSAIKQLALQGKKEGIVKAFGEIGLDYDRLHFADKELQKKYFKSQLEIAVDVDLPLFLHMRAAHDDFVEIISPFLKTRLSSHKHVVHSFTGTKQELQSLLSMGFYVSVNGCSLRTEENLEVAKGIPIDRLLIETDAPWCEIKKSHPSYQLLSAYPNKFYPQLESPGQEFTKDVKSHEFLPVRSVKKEKFKPGDGVVGANGFPVVKSRNEPAFVGLVAEVMASLLDVDSNVLIDNVYKNSMDVFLSD